MRVLMLGSAPMAAEAAAWRREPFDLVLAINNAWRIRPDWDVAIHPFDFPVERQAVAGPGQRIVTEAEFVPAQNAYGGFVYAGATMAFTAFVLLQIVNALNVRSEGTIFSPTTFTNRWLWAALGTVTVLQILVVEVAPMRNLFETHDLNLTQWGICVAAALSLGVFDEIRRAIYKAKVDTAPAAPTHALT